jgi:hypothetical protein
MKPPPLTDELRARLRAFADALIPAAHGMPAAGEVGVGDAQLDRVLEARPDLLEPLGRALAQADPEDATRSLATIHAGDPAAHDALLLTVVGGYYMHPRVRELLGYDGQVPVEVRPEIIPNYVEEELIQPVLERGPIYRAVSASDAQEAGPGAP